MAVGGSHAIPARIARRHRRSNQINRRKRKLQEQGKRTPILAPQDFYSSYLVLDFEATCQKLGVPKPQEIIEFPIVEVCAKTLKPVAEFHSYVRPEVHPKLTYYCRNLTGITQDQVDEAPTLVELLPSVQAWLESRGFGDGAEDKKYLFVTCGSWDLKHALPRNLDYHKVAYPEEFIPWHNLKESYMSHFHLKHCPPFVHMLKELRLELEGRHHSGIDDTRNISRIMIKLLKDGYRFPLHRRYAEQMSNENMESEDTSALSMSH